MHTEAIRLPIGHKLIKHDEAIDGQTVALTQVSPFLFEIHFVTPSGYLHGEKSAGSRVGAEHLFERRLMGSC